MDIDIFIIICKDLSGLRESIYNHKSSDFNYNTTVLYANYNTTVLYA